MYDSCNFREEVKMQWQKLKNCNTVGGGLRDCHAGKGLKDCKTEGKELKG